MLDLVVVLVMVDVRERGGVHVRLCGCVYFFVFSQTVRRSQRREMIVERVLMGSLKGEAMNI